MHIKIWSDIRCPFCYIGKKNFETALNNFQHKDKITIEWKSFELDPNLNTTTTDALTHFTNTKGLDKDRATDMFNHVTAMAKAVGLDFNLEASIPANSFKAHRLLHFAKTRGLANRTKERLLKAHLSEGKNIDDITVLLELSQDLKMNASEVKTMLTSDDYSYEVRQDEMEARNLGINSVPFFVIDNKYGVSGAQPADVFTETLHKVWEQSDSNKTTVTDNHSCNVEGHCI